MAIEEIQRHFAAHIEAVQAAARQLAGTIDRCACLLVDALRDGRKVLVMGNGGSAADAQHLAAELVGRFLLERRALPAIALTTDSSILTAVGNDYGFDQVFRRQVEALAQPGDVVIGISTSGNSPNVLLALQAARAIGCTTVGLLGRDGGKIAPLVDLNLTVAAQQTPHIQEVHGLVVHVLCEQVEKRLFGPPLSAAQAD
ncbi:MAG: D-sedoheptulose 7-phosphate isomerase [Desulfuromonadales bacterium]|nr:D-sedoheptulose 7-phosphate isomerase [Desulfuromonadales bacterium]